MDGETEGDQGRHAGGAPAHEPKDPASARFHRDWGVEGDLDLVDPRHAGLTPVGGMEGGRHRTPEDLID